MTRRVTARFLDVLLIAIFAGLVAQSCEAADVVKPSALYLSLGAADYGTTRWAREQALEKPVHDETTCGTCRAIRERNRDEFVDSPSDNYALPEGCVR